MSDDNPFAGISEFANSLEAKPLTAESLKASYALMESLLNDRGENVVATPRYEVTFRCPECKKFGYATGIVTTCPMCGHEGVMNGDRGYEFLGMHEYKPEHDLTCQSRHGRPCTCRPQ